MGDGTKRNPYTREAVQKKIDKCRSKGEAPNFSNKEFKKGIDLSGLDLPGIILKNAKFPPHFDLKRKRWVGVKFCGSYLTDADLTGADLQYARFQNAHLENATLREAVFRETTFEGAFIDGSDILEAHLEEAYWGKLRKIGIGEEKNKEFHTAVQYYRRLKVWYTQKGYYDIAGEFFFREMEARRKEISWFSRKFCHRFGLECSRWVFGHGERWKRLFFGWIVLAIVIFALLYIIIETFVANHGIWVWNVLSNSFYYSLTYFTALGYSEWIAEPNVWIKWLGAFEALYGVLMIALLVVSLARRWTRL